MFSRKLTYKKIPLLLFLLAVVFFVMSMAGSNAGDDTEKIAAKTEKKILRRVELLEGYVSQIAANESLRQCLSAQPACAILYALS